MLPAVPLRSANYQRPSVSNSDLRRDIRRLSLVMYRLSKSNITLVLSPTCDHKREHSVLRERWIDRCSALELGSLVLIWGGQLLEFISRHMHVYMDRLVLRCHMLGTIPTSAVGGLGGQK